MDPAEEGNQLVALLFRDPLVDADSIFLEQYKLYLGMLDNISERRQHANNFFLTANTGLCAFIGYIFSKNASPEFHNLFWFVPAAGVLLSYFWYRLICSYRDLNTSKFKIVHLMEEHLPVAPFKTEWLHVQNTKRSKRYVPFTHLEVWVPWSFIVMYGGLFLYMIPWVSLWTFITTRHAQ